MGTDFPSVVGQLLCHLLKSELTKGLDPVCVAAQAASIGGFFGKILW